MNLREDEILGKPYDLRLMKRFMAYCRPYIKQIAASVLLLIVISMLQLSGPYLVKVAIDSYILKGNRTGLNLIVTAYLIVLFFTFILEYMKDYIMQLSGQKIMFDIRADLFAHLQKMSLSFFNHNPTGRIVTRVVDDVETLNELFAEQIVETVSDMLTLISIVIVLLLLDWRLASLTFIVIIPLLYATRLYRDRARKAYRNMRANLARLNSYMQENIVGMGTVQVFNRSEENFKRFDTINKTNWHQQLKSLTYYAIYFPVIEIFLAVAIGIIIWYGGGEAIKDAVQLGVLVAFIQYVQRFFQPIKDLSQKYNVLQSAMASSERIFNLMDTPEDIPNPPDPVVLEEVKGEIEFRDVWFSYNSEDPVLKGINFHLKPGESVAIVGATGAGKT